MMLSKFETFVFTTLFFTFTLSAVADDIDIYKINSYKPQVMLLFDDSGSMGGSVLNASGQSESKISIARTAAQAIVQENTNVGFGLMSFTHPGSTSNFSPSLTNTLKSEIHGELPKDSNGDPRDMTTSERSSLVTTIGNLSAYTGTPLCETYYAAYSYFSDHFENNSAPNFTNSCEYKNIIYMTDGTPWSDSCYSGSSCSCASGPDMMNLRVRTYSVAFAMSIPVMQSLAVDDNGATGTAEANSRYKLANGATLLDDFRDIMNEISQSAATSTTSPSVTSNSADPFSDMDFAFFSGFKSSASPRWSGNVKRYELSNGVPTIPVDDDVMEDGFGGMMTNFAGRTIYTVNPSAVTVNSLSNLAGQRTGGFGATGITALATAISGNDAADVAAWAAGMKADGTTRDDILGDILHSKPKVINYGCQNNRTSSCTENNMTIRVLFGTNAGFVHMFNQTGNEQWAFHPPELNASTVDLSRKLKDNISEVNSVNGQDIPVHPYGVDGEFTVYMKDGNNDGDFLDPGTAADSDKVYLFFGLRRGGNMYYAIDISNPNSPNLLWRRTMPAQSWSKPVITFLPHPSIDGDKVLSMVVGGGFTENGTDDRRIYAFNAETGVGVYATNGFLINAQTDGQVVAPLTALDSNGSGATDRIYMGDLLGNVYRVDIAQSTVNTTTSVQSNMVKLRTTIGTKPIFDGIDIVRTYLNKEKVDVLLYGTGDHTTLSANDAANYFYMILDRNIVVNTSLSVTTGVGDANLLNAASGNVQESALVASNGWYKAFSGDERSWNMPRTIAGKVFFTGYDPTGTGISCSAGQNFGTSFLYGLDLFTANTAFTQNKLTYAPGIPGEITTIRPHTGGPEQTVKIFMSDVPGGPNTQPLAAPADLGQPFGDLPLIDSFHLR